MSGALLDGLLAGTLRDPDGAGVLRVPVSMVVIGKDLAAQARDLVAPLDLGNALAVVMDPQTRAAMGDVVAAALGHANAVNTVVFDASPHPDMDAVDWLRARTLREQGLVAVGSGSINDIVKYAAHRDGKPFAVFGTAPSMNGYTSVNAAITEGGLKKSLAATAPRGVFLDLDVLARAPKRLIAAGIGDSLCRATAQVDWLMAHLLLDTTYREAPFMLLAEDEEQLIRSIPAIVSGDESAIEVLARTLVMSGFGMTICGGSYPASQGEHLIAHYIDMLGRGLKPAFHGEHIAVTTMTMAALQERLLARETLTVAPSSETLDDFIAHFGEDLGRSCWEAWLPKRIDVDRARSLNARLARDWNAMRQKLTQIARPAAEISRALAAAGAPTTPQKAGIPQPFYREAVQHARHIRDRFTMLDLAAACGIVPDVASDSRAV